MAALLAVVFAFSPPPAASKETKLKSEVVAAESINPNRHGAPQPVKVHIYYLAHEEAFRQASFGDLVAAGAPALGDDLIRTAEQLVGPGERLELDEKFDEKTQFIGVVAEFTKIDQADWRAVAEVPAKKWTDALKLFSKSKFQVKVDGTAVSCGIVEE
jgi:type VI secretion system protein VasD